MGVKNNNGSNFINHDLNTNQNMQIKEENLQNNFVSEIPDASWNYYETYKNMDSNNNFQSNFNFERDNKSFVNYNNITRDNHLSNNDMDIMDKIKINSPNNSYYNNYDSDPK